MQIEYPNGTSDDRHGVESSAEPAEPSISEQIMKHTKGAGSLATIERRPGQVQLGADWDA